MKRDTRGGSKNPKPKTFGSTPLQLSGDDAAGLVGGIVEKGFSYNSQTRPIGPSAPPRPSVLPFPVARHRSHGPHWAPKVGNFNGNNNDDEDDDLFDVGEEEDFTGMDRAADVANPIRRKEKKGLDFSRWQDIMNNGGSSMRSSKKKGLHVTGVNIVNEVDDQAIGMFGDLKKGGEGRMKMEVDNEDFRFSVNENAVRPVESNDMPRSENSIMAESPVKMRVSSDEMQEDSENQRMTPIQASAHDMQKSIDEEGSLQSQIDAENRALLGNMSAEEIAEAQAEIMSKLNPALINALKRRGEVKVKKQKFSLSDSVSGGEPDTRDRKKDQPNLTASSLNTSSHESVKRTAGEKLIDEGNKSNSSVSPTSHSTWNAWSQRVERVRDLRFSLDGNFINSDLVHVTDTSNTASNVPSQSGYSADNVTERDFLRTEGDPGAAGYTIKEAVALTRSVVPGQRALALHLIAAVLDRAICAICHNQVGYASQSADAKEIVDWEAIWAFALGPEPELALSLRMSLDDNHYSVVLACARAIMCVLSYDMNENIFDVLENTPSYSKDICTAPVFRSKPDINFGFLRGGFWKYNSKPSNIFNFEGSLGDKPEDEPTIQDDMVVAGQDFAAGLVRMGILPRICYLLETDPAASLEECLISILIAIGRHSPTCAAAIMNCERLVEILEDRFAVKNSMEINTSKIKIVKLFKVLSRIEKKNCLTFVKNGIFRKVTWHLYRHPLSLDQWVKSGREACKLSSALLVGQLRLWKVFIHYGYCVSDASDILSSMCIWLSVPTFEMLIENDLMNEYCAITRELYLILDVLAGRLPNFYSHMQERIEETSQDKEYWSWSHFGPIVEQSLEWIDVKRISLLSRFFNHEHKIGQYQVLQDSELNSLLWVISSVLSMLCSLLKAVVPEDILNFPDKHLPWLPDFVPKIGLNIIKNEYFRFSGVSDTINNNHLSENGSIIELLCNLRLKGQESAVSSTCCLQVLVQVVSSIDNLIRHANLENRDGPSACYRLSVEDNILASGILKSSAVEIEYMLSTFMKLISNEWQCMKLVEIFGRGGPAPGVGVGWGASGGGYWSLSILLAEQDVNLLACLLENSEIPCSRDSIEAEEVDCAIQRINCALAASLISGPGNSSVIEKLLKVIFQVPALKAFDFGIRNFLSTRDGFEPFKWNYKDDDYSLFADVLTTHFRSRWVTIKKRKAKRETNQVSDKTFKRDFRSLETIHEDSDVPEKIGEGPSSLTVEWAHQRLHLPAHWFLSAISTVNFGINTPSDSHKDTSEMPLDFLKIAEGGLFLLLGIEAIPNFLPADFGSPANHVSVIWKLHAQSVLLLSGMSVLQNEKSRDIYETLQNIYGGILDETAESLQFESNINENYSTFIETLVEQFAAESYGDMIFGRQVAMYLHGSVEASVRLSAWNALSNARALELLPPLEKCFARAEGYLKPTEDDERILEAYVKSWVSGALVKAATRSSMAFLLVLHHLSSFIFGDVVGDKLTLRNKLAKSLLRDYARKQQHEGMMVKLIWYEIPAITSSMIICDVEKRLQLLKDICGGDSSLVSSMVKLASCIHK